MRKLTFTILALLPFMFIKPALAICALASTSGLLNTLVVTMPLQVANITVGPDTPDGTEVFRQRFNPVISSSGAHVRVTCDTGQIGQFMVDKTLPVTPLPLSSWSKAPYANKVYQTGVPGLGVIVTYGYISSSTGTPFPYSLQACAGVTTHNSCDIPGAQFATNIAIIKTGPVTAGAITGANLPCFKQTMGLAGDMVNMVQGCFSGVMNVVSRTCTTPDVNVNLGKHDVTEFSTVGTATPWVDASIKLSNCPVFYGTQKYGPTWSEDSTVIAGTVDANTLNYSLTPVTSVADSAKGIINIDSAVAQAASGVGIQIAAGTASDNTLFNFGASRAMTLAANQGPTISIPLVARYIQTAASVREMKPGIANGKVTFLINYY